MPNINYYLKINIAQHSFKVVISHWYLLIVLFLTSSKFGTNLNLIFRKVPKLMSQKKWLLPTRLSFMLLLDSHVKSITLLMIQVILIVAEWSKHDNKQPWLRGNTTRRNKQWHVRKRQKCACAIRARENHSHSPGTKQRDRHMLI